MQTHSFSVFTEECIAAQCFVFLTAGSESTSSTISFCLYSVAANPHVQKWLQMEIDTVLAKYNGELNYEALKEMVYLEQVVNGEYSLQFLQSWKNGHKTIVLRALFWWEGLTYCTSLAREM